MALPDKQYIRTIFCVFKVVTFKLENFNRYCLTTIKGDIIEIEPNINSKTKMYSTIFKM